MAKIQLSKKNLHIILGGYIVILLIKILTVALIAYVNIIMVRNFSVDDFESAYTQQPYFTIFWIFRIITFITPIFGGFLVGRLIKNKGWFYGGLLGIIPTVLSILVTSLIFLLPAATSNGQAHSSAQQNIINTLIGSPLLIGLTALGGFFGELYSKRSHKKK